MSMVFFQKRTITITKLSPFALYIPVITPVTRRASGQFRLLREGTDYFSSLLHVLSLDKPLLQCVHRLTLDIPEVPLTRFA